MPKSNKLLVFTNLYPTPWQPTRATFNRQQFAHLTEYAQLYFLVPVPWMEWFKNRHKIHNTSSLKYVPYFYLPKYGRRFSAQLMYLSMRLIAWKWIKDTGAKKLLGCWAYPDACAAQRIANKLALEFYMKVHGSDVHLHLQNPSRKKQIVKCANKALGILSVSKDLASHMVNSGIDVSRINVIYNGVNLSLFGQAHSVNQDSFLYIGNLKSDKGIYELLEGFKAFSHLNPAYKLRIAGGGPELKELASKIVAWDLSDKVELLGVVAHQQLPALLAESIALCLPSYHEGVPNVVLEAMAAGIPTLATDVGGIPEVLPNYCGILIKPCSSEAVTQGLLKIVEGQWDEQQIRRQAENYRWDENAIKLAQMLTLEVSSNSSVEESTL